MLDGSFIPDNLGELATPRAWSASPGAGRDSVAVVSVFRRYEPGRHLAQCTEIGSGLVDGRIHGSGVDQGPAEASPPELASQILGHLFFLH